jgi:toxin YoeB
MRLVFTPLGWEDNSYWQIHDKAIFKRLNRLLDDVLRNPSDGIGKPEPLRHVLEGCWSRRIDEDHRLIYLVDADDVVLLQARFHCRSS